MEASFPRNVSAPWALAVFSAAAAVVPALPVVVGQISALPAHELEARVGARPADLVDLATPFAVVGAAALLLAAERARGSVLVLAGVAAILYAAGHGIHLAGNALNAHDLPADAARAANFWDEQLGHAEWHAGWLGLLAAAALAEPPGSAFSWRPALASVALLSPALFAYTVEGGSWWLVVASVPLFLAIAVIRRGHVSATCAAAVAVAAVLIGIWAVRWGSVPQLTEVW